MCYTFSSKKIETEEGRLWREYVNHFATLENSYVVNGFTHPEISVITNERPDYFQAIRWGLVPFWCKDDDVAGKMAKQCLNAQSETIAEKNAFKAAKDKRCAILATGFYEHRHIGAKNTYPYFIKLKERDYFFMGGLYSSWKDPQTGAVIPTVSILTTAANPMMEMIHNQKKRMPVILTDEMLGEWLSDKPTKAVESLMQPFDENEMDAWTISKLLTSRTSPNNVPEVQQPFAYPELAQQKSLF